LPETALVVVLDSKSLGKLGSILAPTIAAAASSEIAAAVLSEIAAAVGVAAASGLAVVSKPPFWTTSSRLGILKRGEIVGNVGSREGFCRGTDFMVVFSTATPSAT
jgi:hypothetical protein